MQITAEIEMSRVTEVGRNVHGDMTNNLFCRGFTLHTLHLCCIVFYIANNTHVANVYLLLPSRRPGLFIAPRLIPRFGYTSSI